MEVEVALREFGLTDLESKLYHLLLKTGETTAPALVSKLKVHKATVYDLLSVLERKGLASHVNREGRNYYSPVDPKCLIEILEGKMNAIMEIYPTLEKYYSSNKAEREIKVLEGKAAVKSMFLDMAKAGKPVLALGASMQMMGIMGHRLVHPLKNLKTTIPLGRTIVANKKEAKEEVEKVKAFCPTIEARYYPEKNNSPAAFITYGDRLNLILWQSDPLVISIKDPCFAKAFRSYFDIIWNASKTSPED
ncbi:MAG: hypothetical protein JW727_05455 [Candidatus Aenigmarchaeota archaeon]|nr:hypothetical protein [Candidatus Aenigmarchaeota archaeon]